MRNRPRFYLCLGSNIERERNLAEAIRLLRKHGDVQAISGVWESHAVGSDGPDFFNVCVCFVSPVDSNELKRDIVGSIESALGRARTSDKNSPRTIDIDILMQADQPMNIERWAQAFVVVPMADLLPNLLHPLSHKRLAEEAADARASTWIQRRPDVLKGLGEENKA
jgi:2-amino-4-hydroxy-6-hydroxymethyldihydropteridine diphosphokinase